VKYWQITTRRMSRAAQKLEMDEVWHPSNASPLSWYRVWHKRMIQRVQFESVAEEQSLLPRLGQFEPVAERSGVEGFREQLVLESTERGMMIVSLLGYPITETESNHAFEHAIEAVGNTTQVRNSLLFLLTPLPELSSKSVIKSEELITHIKLLYQALNFGGGIQAALYSFQRATQSG
jgi:hypothetical protein